jgi:putative flippase GtrA
MTEFDLPPEKAPPGPLIRLVRDQRVAFLVVGGINTVVGLAIFVACSVTVGHVVDHRFGKVAGTVVTVVIAHVLAVLFAFVMHRRFVFRVRGLVLRDLARFWSVYLTGAGINIVALAALVELGLGRIPAQVIIVAFNTLLSYFGHRHFSFRRSPADTQGDP